VTKTLTDREILDFAFEHSTLSLGELSRAMGEVSVRRIQLLFQKYHIRAVTRWEQAEKETSPESPRADRSREET
jgi:hypothetical protein